MALVLTCTAGSFNTRSSCREKCEHSAPMDVINDLKILDKLNMMAKGQVVFIHHW